MIKTWIKHKLSEVVVDTLFTNISNNFNDHILHFTIGEHIEEIHCNYSDQVKSDGFNCIGIFTGCKITQVNNSSIATITTTYMERIDGEDFYDTESGLTIIDFADITKVIR